MTLKISRSQVSTQPNPTHKKKFKKTLTQPNPWMDQTHDQLCTHSLTHSLTYAALYLSTDVNLQLEGGFAF